MKVFKLQKLLCSLILITALVTEVDAQDFSEFGGEVGLTFLILGGVWILSILLLSYFYTKITGCKIAKSLGCGVCCFSCLSLMGPLGLCTLWYNQRCVDCQCEDCKPAHERYVIAEPECHGSCWYCPCCVAPTCCGEIAICTGKGGANSCGRKASKRWREKIEIDETLEYVRKRKKPVDPKLIKEWKLKQKTLSKSGLKAWLSENHVRVVDNSQPLYGREDGIKSVAALRKKVKHWDGPKFEHESWLDHDNELKKHISKGGERQLINKISNKLLHRAVDKVYTIPTHGIIGIGIWALVILMLYNGIAGSIFSKVDNSDSSSDDEDSSV